MTYENWCKNSGRIIERAEKYNRWADKAKGHLLTRIGPLIECLRLKGYMGCGFHYEMEQNFGKLIIGLSMSWQPCANWCEKIEDDQTKALMHQACFRHLLKQIRKARKSILPPCSPPKSQ